MLNYTRHDLNDFQNGGEPNFTVTDLNAMEQEITRLRGEVGNVAETSSVSSKNSSRLLHHLILSLIGVTPDVMTKSIDKSGRNRITDFLTSNVSRVYPHLSHLMSTAPYIAPPSSERLSGSGRADHPSIQSLNIEVDGPEWERFLGQWDWRWQGSSSADLTGIWRPQAAAGEGGFDDEPFFR
jgi:hypothetical protein